MASFFIKKYRGTYTIYVGIYSLNYKGSDSEPAEKGPSYRRPQVPTPVRGVRARLQGVPPPPALPPLPVPPGVLRIRNSTALSHCYTQVKWTHHTHDHADAHDQQQKKAI